MNDKTLKTYGLNSREELQGKKCYEILHNNSTRCKNCINNKLTKGKFVENKEYNPRVKKYLLTKDTIVEYNDKLYRLNISIDVSEQEEYNKAIRKYENIEATVNEAIRTAMQAHNPDDAINIILEYLGKTLDGERTYVFEKNEFNHDDNTYEWVAKGVIPSKDMLQNVPPEVCENWYNSFEKGNPIVIEDIESIKEINYQQYETLKIQNIRSIVVVPLIHEGKIIGFYGVDNPPVNDIKYVENMLKITGYFIVSQIQTRNLIRELHDMSYRDQLTKIGNRHAMRKYIKNMNKSRSIGVVYCDITRLKWVNDNEGHAAGDALIKRCSSFLNDFYKDYGVFRIGGDELLALCSCISKGEFESREKQFRDTIAEQKVPLAVGFSWKESSCEDVGEILHEAEMAMYKDKAEFYRKSGIERRK
ncbi:MAG: sensor domain-containing diguanylate cyclase [Ruminococcus sp.]|nr:sensor domain-containing diguanylate cyclase [Ruminococcus sp.]